MEQLGTSQKRFGQQLLVCWLLALAFYYLADAAMDALIFGEGAFTEQLLQPELHEISIRLMSAFFLGIVLAFAWRLMVKRKQSEVRLSLANRQLLQANADLDAYNHTLAHDLRNPLAGLVTACSLAREQTAGQANTSALQLSFDTIETSCQRIESIISGLHKLASLGHAPLTCQPVDLSRLAHATLQSLASVNPDRVVDTDITPGLCAEADPEQIAVLMENLIGNAWKFSVAQNPAKLAFGAIRQSDRQIFFIRDNGVGFDLQQASQLFKPFVRLHEHRQFPGQGIGLATVKRIVSLHGGEIWVDSAPGQGTTFYFTLQPA